MSLLGTLAKIAVGVAVVKGVGGMMQRQDRGSAMPEGGRAGVPGSGSVFGGQHSPRQRETGLEDMMGDVLRGRRGGAGAAPGDSGSLPDPAGGGLAQGGGLGDLLESLGGAQTAGGAAGGGLGDVIGQLGKGGAGGSLGDLLGGILGGALGAGVGAAVGGSAGAAIAGGIIGGATGAMIGAAAQPRPGYYAYRRGCYVKVGYQQYRAVNPRYCY